VIRVLIAGGGTGGHLMPALALAEALVGVRGDVEPVLVGAVRGVEARILPTRPYRYHLLPTEPIYRRQWWRNARWIVVLPRLLGAVRRLLDAERPAVVVSTGGYAAGPVAFAAARRGIPIVVQEQNTVPGITTRRLAGRARQIHLGFPEAAARLIPDRGRKSSPSAIRSPRRRSFRRRMRGRPSGSRRTRVSCSSPARARGRGRSTSPSRRRSTRTRGAT